MEAFGVKMAAEAAGARLLGCEEVSFDNVRTDSRKVTKGSLFVAIKGEKVDGHTFIHKALELGASAILLSDESYLPEIEAVSGVAALVAPDVEKALGLMAHEYRMQFHIPVVGVTGSVGKTSTKDLTAAALSDGFKVLKTQGNFNNKLGLPLTLFELDSTIEAAVIEIGMEYPGDIDYLAGLAAPTMSIITNIGTSHIEHFGSREGLLKGKLEIVRHTKDYEGNPGPVYVCGDDPLLERAAEFEPGNYYYFGIADSEDATIIDIARTKEGLLYVPVRYKGVETDLEIDTLGRHMALNAAPALMAAQDLGLSSEQIRRGFLNYEPTPRRLERKTCRRYLLIDDTYNASPSSMESALRTLADLDPARRKVAILGDIFELGSFSKRLHGDVGAYVRQMKGLDVCLFCGHDAKYMYEQANYEECQAGLYYFETKEELLKNVFTILHEGDIILVKASNGMHFNELVEAILKQGN